MGYLGALAGTTKRQPRLWLQPEGSILRLRQDERQRETPWLLNHPPPRQTRAALVSVKFSRVSLAL